MKTSIKNIIVIPEYSDDIHTQLQIYNLFKNNYQIVIFDWTKLEYNSSNDILDLISNEINKFILNTKLKLNETLVIAKGLSATLLFQNQNNLSLPNLLAINPYFAKSLINPYTSKIPSYKCNIDHFWNKLGKEFYTRDSLFANKESSLFKKYYDFFSSQYNFYEKIISTINDYIHLKNIKKNEKFYNLSSVNIILGVHNKVIDIKKTLAFLKNQKTNVTIFSQSSHQIEFDEQEKYLQLIKQLINH